MSYDFTLYVDTGNGHRVSVYYDNYTSNMRRFFADAIDPNAEHGHWADAINGKTGADTSFLLLEAASRAFLFDADEYDALNGWGDVASARQVLAAMAEAAEAHPIGVWEVSW